MKKKVQKKVLIARHGDEGGARCAGGMTVIKTGKRWSTRERVMMTILVGGERGEEIVAAPTRRGQGLGGCGGNAACEDHSAHTQA